MKIRSARRASAAAIQSWTACIRWWCGLRHSRHPRATSWNWTQTSSPSARNHRISGTFMPRRPRPVGTYCTNQRRGPGSDARDRSISRRPLGPRSRTRWTSTPTSPGSGPRACGAQTWTASPLAASARANCRGVVRHTTWLRRVLATQQMPVRRAAHRLELSTVIVRSARLLVTRRIMPDCASAAWSPTPSRFSCR